MIRTFLAAPAPGLFAPCVPPQALALAYLRRADLLAPSVHELLGLLGDLRACRRSLCRPAPCWSGAAIRCGGFCRQRRGGRQMQSGHEVRFGIGASRQARVLRYLLLIPGHG